MSSRNLACVLLLVVTEISSSTAVAGSRPPVLLTIHTEVSGLEPAEKRLELPLEEPPFVFSVGKMPDITDRQLMGVLPGPAPLQFDTTGARVLRNITTTNRNLRLAVLINGRLVFSPVIDATISNGELFLPRGISPEVLEQLREIAQRNARKFRKKPVAR